MKVYMANMSHYWRNGLDYEDIDEDVLGIFDSIEKAQRYIDSYGETLQHVEEKPEEVERWHRIGVKFLYKIFEYISTDLSERTKTLSEGYAFFIREFEVQ